MVLPAPVAKLWDELQQVRSEILGETERLSQGQADWKPSAQDWSVGELIDHLTMGEIATGKLTTKLTREAAAGGAPPGFPRDLTELAALPDWPPGPAEAPPVVWPGHGKSIVELIATMKATRERSRESVEKLGALDPRVLKFKHFRLGDLDLAQWWKLQAHHDRIHLAQIREVKSTPGFPRS